MKNILVKYNRNPAQFARTKRQHLSGSLLICVAGLACSGEPIHQDPARLFIQESSILNTELVNQNGYDVIFKAILNLIMNLLDQLLETKQSGLLLISLEASLSQTAATLITSYPVYGVDQSLTSTEVSLGLVDCKSALEMLKDPTIDLSLTESVQTNLETTITQIVGDLNSAP